MTSITSRSETTIITNRYSNRSMISANIKKSSSNVFWPVFIECTATYDTKTFKLTENQFRTQKQQWTTHKSKIPSPTHHDLLFNFDKLHRILCHRYPRRSDINHTFYHTMKKSNDTQFFTITDQYQYFCINDSYQSHQFTIYRNILYMIPIITFVRFAINHIVNMELSCMR